MLEDSKLLAEEEVTALADTDVVMPGLMPPLMAELINAPNPIEVGSAGPLS